MANFIFLSPTHNKSYQTTMSTQHTWLGSPTFLHQSSLTKNIDAWTENLTNDPDRDFLLRGLKDGFCIVSHDSNLRPEEVTNYKSTTGDDVCNKVEKAMQEEIQHGNYIITTE